MLQYVTFTADLAQLLII